MKVLLKIFASFLLLINGVGAIYGGIELLSAVDGRSVGWTLDMLKHTPFHDYFFPGLILFVANGLFDFFVLIMLLLNDRRYSKLVTVQGFILTGWIVIQVMLLQSIVELHLIMGAIGVLLILCGIALVRINAIRSKSKYFRVSV